MSDTFVPEPSVRDAVSDLRSAAEGTYNAVRQDAETTKEAALSKLQLVKENATEKVARLKEIAADKAGVVKAKAEEGWNVTCTQAKHLQESSQVAIQENPFKAVGIAFGVGIVVGLLIGRK